MPIRWQTPLISLSIGSLLSVGCGSPVNAIHPVIYADADDAAAAMRSAPVILLVRIAHVKATGDVKAIAKPPEVGGPMAPTIPLHLARINAGVLLTVKGTHRTTVDFYSWIWASGSHGGPRLFRPAPGAIRVVFLRNEGGYLHTVGDYPSYDLELPSRWLHTLIDGWDKNGRTGIDEVERLVAVRLRAEFEALSEQELHHDFGDDGPRVNHHWVRDLNDLTRLVGPLFVVRQLDDICLHSTSRAARFGACYVTGRYFPGRCEAFNLARKTRTDGFGEAYLVGSLQSCEIRNRDVIDDFRRGALPLWVFYGASDSPRHRRETMQVYATAMDRPVHRAVCEAAATRPATHDLPECSADVRTQRRDK